jgi:hypothetical protein
MVKQDSSSSSSSSLHGLGEYPLPASSIVLSLSISFLVYLCLVFRMVEIYMPVEQCGYVPFFADEFSIYTCILLFFRLKGKCSTHFLCLNRIYPAENKRITYFIAVIILI